MEQGERGGKEREGRKGRRRRSGKDGRSWRRWRLTVRVRVAVEALTGRRAAEVGVAEEPRLTRGVAQAVLRLDVCVWRDDTKLVSSGGRPGDNLSRFSSPASSCSFLAVSARCASGKSHLLEVFNWAYE